ncbi:MAG: O-GlcNAc transferase, partial [Verrucomicrobia bacterium]
MFANTAFSKSGNPRETRRSLLSRDWLLGFCLIGITLIAYGQTWHAGFIWDDESHLTQNPCIIGPLGLKEIWTSTQAVYYPLVLTTFWILHKFFGLNPSPYHMLNVLMHAGSAALLWRVLRQLNVRGAWLGAALWALHPVIVQSVAWVTELKNTQSCLFYLLSIFWFLKVDANETSDRVRWWRFGWALLFFVLAIVSKPSTVMLPGVLALCVWWRRGRIRWRDIANLIPFVLISALASAWTIWEQKFHSGASGAEWAQTWPDRLIIAGRA